MIYNLKSLLVIGWLVASWLLSIWGW